MNKLEALKTFVSSTPRKVVGIEAYAQTMGVANPDPPKGPFPQYLEKAGVVIDLPNKKNRLKAISHLVFQAGFPLTYSTKRIAEDDFDPEKPITRRERILLLSSPLIVDTLSNIGGVVAAYSSRDPHVFAIVKGGYNVLIQSLSSGVTIFNEHTKKRHDKAQSEATSN